MGALLLAGCPHKGPALSEEEAEEEWARLSRTVLRSSQEEVPEFVRRVQPAARAGEAARKTRRATVEVLWSPRTGKGEVRQVLPNGDALRACFSCEYPDFAGGLSLGRYNGSGYQLWPARPVRKFHTLNFFGVLDESLWDLDRAVERHFGWSDNFGGSTDGRPLGYVTGAVVSRGPGRVVLRSVNAGGCFRLTRAAALRPETRYWVLATRIENTCGRPVRWHYFVGDDAWIGRFRAAPGDVGWSPAGLRRTEGVLGAGTFSVGGMYDLGDDTLDPEVNHFSGQASFLAVDPAGPAPDFAAVANGFAHGPADLDAGRLLKSTSPTAFNVGWKDRTLQPGAHLDLVFALGQAEVSRPGALPSAPKIPETDWQAARAALP